MRNMLSFLALIVLLFLGVGWYLDWYDIQSTPSGPGKHSYTIDINSGKISEDLHRSLNKRGEQPQDRLENAQHGGPASHVPNVQSVSPPLQVPNSRRSAPLPPDAADHAGPFAPTAAPEHHWDRWWFMEHPPHWRSRRQPATQQDQPR
ncbi:MAG: hypothetical protein ACK4RK_20950 [Gemmataceae bacterium]